MGPLTPEVASTLLYGEARALDERRWDDWLALYAEDAVYWVPSWKNETETTSDPDSELSLIYYDSRAGLEDRIWRLKSGLSVASNPLRRTVHVISNVQVLEGSDDDTAEVRASGVTHVYDPRRKGSAHFYGLYAYRLRRAEDGWRIAAKTIRLMNDNIPAVLDVYML